MRLLIKIGGLPLCTLYWNKTVDTQMYMLTEFTPFEVVIRKASRTLNSNKVTVVTLHVFAHTAGYVL